MFRVSISQKALCVVNHFMLKLGVHTSDRFCPQKGKALTVQLPVARGLPPLTMEIQRKRPREREGIHPTLVTIVGMAWFGC